jgi:hypothetical protein
MGGPAVCQAGVFYRVSPASCKLPDKSRWLPPVAKAYLVRLTAPSLLHETCTRTANVYTGGRMNVVGGGQKWQSPVAS